MNTRQPTPDSERPARGSPWNARQAVNVLPMLLACLLPATVPAAEPVNSGGYRGPARNGIFPATGLMKSWPDGGPPLLWRYENLGNSWSAVTVAGDTIYAVGGGSVGRLFAFTMDGRLKWRKRYGREFSVRYQGCRSTPTVAGRNVVLASGLGVIYCLDAAAGETRWSVDTAEAFSNQVPGWGYNITPLVVGRKVILPIRRGRCTMVALDVDTGKEIWANEPSEYAIGDTSPMLVRHGNTHLVVNNLWNGLVAVDPDTGKTVWKREGEALAGTSLTPVFNEGYLLLDWARKTVMLRPRADGTGFDELWQIGRIFSTAQAVILDGKVFAFGTLRLDSPSGGKSGKRSRTTAYLCYDAETGKLLKAVPTKGAPGSVVAADGMIYWQEEGLRLSLAKPTADGFEIVSTFEPDFGGKEMWIHPVIARGRLFVRSDCAQGGNRDRAAGKLAVYDLRAEQAATVRARRAEAAALVRKLESEKAPDRVEAARALLAMGWRARPAAAALARALTDTEPAVRRAAAETLGKIGPTAIPALVRSLRSDAIWSEGLAAKALVAASNAGNLPHAVLDVAEGAAMVRDDALAVLKRIGPRAAPAATKLLASADRHVRWWAIDVLLLYGPEAKVAVPELIRIATEQDQWFRAKAARTLAAIGPAAKDAAPALLALLKHPWPDARIAAAEALAAVGARSEKTLTALKAAAGHQDENVAAAAKAALVSLGASGGAPSRPTEPRPK